MLEYLAMYRVCIGLLKNGVSKNLKHKNPRAGKPVILDTQLHIPPQHSLNNRKMIQFKDPNDNYSICEFKMKEPS